MSNAGRWIKIVILLGILTFLLVDIYLWVARPPGVTVAWGRIFFGVAFQFISLGLFSLLEVREKRSPASKVLARPLISILIPVFVLGWIGSDLVHKGIYQGGQALKYRGQK